MHNYDKVYSLVAREKGSHIFKEFSPKLEMLLKFSKKLLVFASCVAFLIQLYQITHDTIYPTITTTNIYEDSLVDIPFIFKICPNPAFNASVLHSLGYNSSTYYFIGRSAFNFSVYGWAGHNKNNTILTKPENIYSKISIFTDPKILMKR